MARKMAGSLYVLTVVLGLALELRVETVVKVGGSVSGLAAGILPGSTMKGTPMKVSATWPRS